MKASRQLGTEAAQVEPLREAPESAAEPGAALGIVFGLGSKSGVGLTGKKSYIRLNLLTSNNVGLQNYELHQTCQARPHNLHLCPTC